LTDVFYTRTFKQELQTVNKDTWLNLLYGPRLRSHL